jgi:hypothetical protein
MCVIHITGTLPGVREDRRNATASATIAVRSLAQTLPAFFSLSAA